jgi:phosphonate transport system substrate-binding protein
MTAASCSRRHALATMLGIWPCLRRTLAAEPGGPLRVAISETMVVDVNLSDARAAMQTWIKRLQADLNVDIWIDPKVFSTAEDIVRLVRSGQLDAAAMSVVEYRPASDLFDTTEIFVGAGSAGPDEYLLMVKRDNGFSRLADLRGRRLSILNAPKMCVAPAWLSTLLEEARLGSAEGFFASMTADAKVSRVVLPVFFGQADACLTSKRGFELMCELNPQVASNLTPLAASSLLVTCFYAFRKTYHGPNRERFFNLHNTLLSSAAGRQLATLFHFEELTIRDAGCLASSLGILDRVERLRTKLVPGGRKGSI